MARSAPKPSPQRVERAGPEVLDHHVGARDQLQQDLSRARVVQVEREAPLVAVHASRA